MKSLLALPEGYAASGTHADAINAWQSYLGIEAPLLFVRDTSRARKLLMRALGVTGGEPVGVPANTRRALSEAVKRSGGTPRFIELDADLGFARDTPGLDATRVLWAQPVGGMAPPAPVDGKRSLIDYGFTLPGPVEGALTGDATLWGLHLPGDEGALIAFSDAALYEAALDQMTPEDELTDIGSALAQCRRLDGPDGLAARLLYIDQEVRLGMDAGAGLPVSPTAGRCALPFGLPVRIPVEADLPTFISYARNENVVVDWLPELQPMFYVAWQVTRNRTLTQRSAEHLSRWVISPLGPDYGDDEITHAVLGILKAAEYTGVRWYTDPQRARWYHDLMLEWYGPTHDAYRSAFLPVLELAAD